MALSNVHIGHYLAQERCLQAIVLTDYFSEIISGLTL